MLWGCIPCGGRNGEYKHFVICFLKKGTLLLHHIVQHRGRHGVVFRLENMMWVQKIPKERREFLELLKKIIVLVKNKMGILL